MMFTDDNIIGNPFYSEELLKALVPLNEKWFGQASLSGLRKVENVELLAKSGCISLFIGFESLPKKNLVAASDAAPVYKKENPRRQTKVSWMKQWQSQAGIRWTSEDSGFLLSQE